MTFRQFLFDLLAFLLVDHILREFLLHDSSYAEMLYVLIACSFTHCNFNG